MNLTSVDDGYDVERIIKNGFAEEIQLIELRLVSLIKFSSDITWDLTRKKTSYELLRVIVATMPNGLPDGLLKHLRVLFATAHHLPLHMTHFYCNSHYSLLFTT